MTYLMEKIGSKSIPPIFKLSSLCHILPYYGFLHQWKFIFELISKKTSVIWDENKEVFKNLGKDHKSIVVCKYVKHTSYHFPKNAELFVLKLESKYDLNKFIQVGTKGIQSWWFDALILDLLEDLDENKSIIIDEDYQIPANRFIRFLTKNESAKMVPSSLCTSFKSNIVKCWLQQSYSLCKVIDEKIKNKRIVLTKLKSNKIEINSVIPELYSTLENYNIKYQSNYEKIEDMFSCPVDSCIWKPTFLCYKTKLKNDDRVLYEHINEKNVESIWKVPYLRNIKQLNIEGNVNSFESIDNLIRISEIFPHIKIKFGVDYKTELIDWEYNCKLNIKEKKIIWVHKGKQWCFESVDKSQVILFCWFENIKSVERKGLNIYEVSSFKWNGITSKTCCSDITKQPFIDKLKNISMNNDKLYIIADKDISTFITDILTVKE